MAKRTGTAGFFRNVTDGLQTNAFSFPLGGLKNSIFFQNFSHICIFNLDQQKISGMKVGSYPDMPGAPRRGNYGTFYDFAEPNNPF